MGTQTEKSGNSIVVAAMICVTALILGAMAMWCVNGGRYEYHHNAENGAYDKTIYYTIIFDKRTGKCYTSSGTALDYVNAESLKRQWDHAMK